MTTRLIENCLDSEVLEEEEYTKYISIRTNARLIVVDPYMINVQDLIHAKPGKVALVRARRPAWGIEDLHRFIFVIE